MIYDLAVIGGGIVGLATTREFGRRFPRMKIAVIEKEDSFNRHQTGRNSGVIHSGIYYKPGSLKAKLCVEGRRLIWAYCDRKGIPYQQVGKLIVATDPRELPQLHELWNRGRENGIDDLRLLDATQIAACEPHCRGIAAIASPSTGIIDWTVVAQSYADDAREAGATFYLDSRVTNIVRRNGATHVVASTPLGTEEIEARNVVTCAGLYSDKVAQLTGGASDPQIVPFRGEYFILKPEKRHLIKGNIYPVPDPAFPFLGVHFTPRMDGSLWLGPNAVLAFAREGYSFFDCNPGELWDAVTYKGFINLARKHWRTGASEMVRALVRREYVRALQKFIPELTPDDCLKGPSGVRAQAVSSDGALVDDFLIEGSEGVLHVRNAPSPAATSSLAIAQYIVDSAVKRFGLRTPVMTV
ncbi:MAG: L-2-hydroxyglutarate oxidase [Polyangiales bacterium]